MSWPNRGQGWERSRAEACSNCSKVEAPHRISRLDKVTRCYRFLKKGGRAHFNSDTCPNGFLAGHCDTTDSEKRSACANCRYAIYIFRGVSLARLPLYEV